MLKRIWGTAPYHPDKYEFYLYQSIVRAIDKGYIFCNESIRYKSLSADLLSDKVWQKKDELIQKLGYPNIAVNIEQRLNELENKLHAKILEVNKRITNKENSYIKIKESKKSEGNKNETQKHWHLTTPTVDETDDNFFKGVPTINIGELLYLINTQTGFCDAFDHVKPRYSKQKGGGLAALAAGLAFPPILPAMGPIAGTLISEGISDIVLELISQGDSEFSEREFAKGKLISYGISVATMGIGAIASSIKILNQAVKACRGLSKALHNSKFMKAICVKVADKIDDIGKFLEKTLTKVKIEKVAQAEKLGNLSKAQKFSSVTKNIAKETITDVTGSVIMEKVVTKSLDRILENLKPQIKQQVESILLSNIKQGVGSEPEIVRSCAMGIIEGTNGEIAAEIAQEIALGVLRHSHNWKLKAASLTIDSLVLTRQLIEYPQDFCDKINARLENGISINSYEELVEMVTNKLYGLILSFSGKMAHTCATGPALNKLSQKFAALGKKNKEKSVVEYDAKKQANGTEEAVKHTKTQEAVDILKIKPDATTDEVKKAYRKAILEHHPDKGGTDAEFNKVQEAYEHLNNKIKRQQEAIFHEEVQRLNNMVDGKNQYDVEQHANKPQASSTQELQSTGPLDLERIKVAATVMNTPLEIRDESGNVIFRNRNSGTKEVSKYLVHKQGGQDGVGHMEVRDAKTGQLIAVKQTGSNTCVIDCLAHLSTQSPEQVHGTLSSIERKSQDWWTPEYDRKTASLMDEARQGKIFPQEFDQQCARLREEHLVSGAPITKRKPVCDKLDKIYNGNKSLTDAQKDTKAKAYLEKQGYELVGYHGTTKEGASSLLGGDRPKMSRPDNTGTWDGFYVSDKLEVAKGYKVEDGQILAVYRKKNQPCNMLNSNTDINNLVGDIKIAQSKKNTYIATGPENPHTPSRTEKVLSEKNQIVFIPYHENPVGQGMEEHNNTSYWNEYSKIGLSELLELRLESMGITEVKIVTPNQVWDGTNSAAHSLIEGIMHILTGEKEIVLVPLNLYAKHWVGLVVEKEVDKLKFTYMDPENNSVSEVLFASVLTAFVGLGYEVIFDQPELEKQHSNNCGPEVIENFILYLTESRLSQEETVVYHSYLLEKKLLSEGSDTIDNSTAFLSDHQLIEVDLQLYGEVFEMI